LAAVNACLYDDHLLFSFVVTRVVFLAMDFPAISTFDELYTQHYHNCIYKTVTTISICQISQWSTLVPGIEFVLAIKPFE
jgi:hypothetical protein